jgi:hypothetical protein
MLLTTPNSRAEQSMSNFLEERRAAPQLQEDISVEIKVELKTGIEEDQGEHFLLCVKILEGMVAEDRGAGPVAEEAREEGQDPETEETVTAEATEMETEIEEIVTEVTEIVNLTETTVNPGTKTIQAEEGTDLDPRAVVIENTEINRRSDTIKKLK